MRRVSALISVLLLLAGCGAPEPAPAAPQAETPPAVSRAEDPPAAYPAELLPREGLEPPDWTLADFPGLFEGGGPVQREARLLLEGTELENTVTVLRGEEEGPAVYVVAGVHGDETAGWMAGGLLKRAALRAGTLYILSPANPYGAEHDRRNTKSDRDLNRNFPGDPEGWDAERIAAALFAHIEESAPVLVLDLHEARVHQGERDNLGNSVICQSLDGVGELVLDILLESEAGGLCAAPITLYGSPPPGSLNRTVTLELGVPVITVETSRAEPLAQRVRTQLELAEFVLENCGLL